MTRVFMCDDSDWFCELVAAWFEDHGDLELVGCAHERYAALALVTRTRPDVVMLDTMTYGLEPIPVTDVRAAAPSAQVLICSSYPAEFVAGLLGEGDGYVSKDDGQHAILAAIRALGRHTG